LTGNLDTLKKRLNVLTEENDEIKAQLDAARSSEDMVAYLTDRNLEYEEVITAHQENSLMSARTLLPYS
jgi:predicted transcriptional regulator